MRTYFGTALGSQSIYSKVLQVSRENAIRMNASNPKIFVWLIFGILYEVLTTDCRTPL